MPKKMTAKSASRLTTAIDMSQDYIDQDMSPTEAIIKVARELSLPPEMIRLVAQAHNIGEQTALHKSAENILDRLSHHPLADGQKAIDTVYGEKQASVASRFHGQTVDSVYSTPPQIKEAFAGLPPVGGVPKLKAPASNTMPPSGAPKLRSAISQSKMAMKVVEDAEAATYTARDRMLQALSKVAYWLRRQPDHVAAFEIADYYAPQLFGADGRVVMDHVANSLDDVRRPIKRASAAPTRLVEAHAGIAPYDMIEEAIKCGKAWITSVERHEQLKIELPEKIAELLAPFDHALQTTPEILVGHTAMRAKESNLLHGMLGGAVADRLTSGIQQTRYGKPTEDLTSDARSQFESAQHQNNLRAIDSQVLLHDLLQNDDTLAGYPQEQVLGAYNQLSELGPRLSSQPMLMRPILHKMMAQGGQLDPHDVEQAANLDRMMAQRELPKTAALWETDSVLAQG